MYDNILRVMLARQYPAMFKNGVDAQTDYLIRQAWDNRSARGAEGAGSAGSAGITGGTGSAKSAHAEEGAQFLRHMFGTNAALVGIGAPTHVFLPAVAKALGAECILPENAEVANALGALMADIDVISRMEISQRLASNGAMYYIAHAPAGSKRFDNLGDAIEMAKEASAEAALKEARSRGASGRIDVKTYVEKNRATTDWGTDVSLGSAVVSEVKIRLA
jgi:N-methylhydantoinase A/oxoprolinase/acetone carboxylase beta subunit